MSLLDIDERLVELLKHVEFNSSPITDLKHPPSDGVDVGILTGAIGNSHQVEAARLMRERAKTLVAMGDCAVFGGICTMRNFFNTKEVLRRGYVESESTVDGKVPESEDLGNSSTSTARKQVVGGCLPHGLPPSADAIASS